MSTPRVTRVKQHLQSLESNDRKIKPKYQQGVLDVEMGSFTSLVFGTNGGMDAECKCFLKHLDEKPSEKNEKPCHFSTTWIRTLLSFKSVSLFKFGVVNKNYYYEYYFIFYYLILHISICIL